MIHLLAELKEFFSGKKEEKKQLRKKLLDEYGRKVPESYDVEKLKEVLSLLESEKTFLEEYKDTEFMFFGYLRSDEELPKFFFEKRLDEDSVHVTAVAPFTPKTFSLCLKNLENSEKLDLMKDDFLKKAFWKIAYHSKYQEENWSEAFREIKHYLESDCERIERELGEKITAKDLSIVDWDSFCEEIKPYVGPSYDKKPESVEIKEGKNAAPVAYVKMKSKTTPSTRTFRICRRDISQSTNDGSNGYRDCCEEINEIWKRYFGHIIKRYMCDIRDDNNSHSTM